MRGDWTKYIFGLAQLLGFFGSVTGSDADRLAYVEEHGPPARELLYDPNGNLVESRELETARGLPG